MTRFRAKDRTDADTFARFMRQVEIGDVPGSCWWWTGNLGDGRYGAFSLNGKSVKAHRWIYELLFGEVPEGLIMRHRCDQPRCVNPQHLTVGTHADNRADMFERGRGPNRKGDRHPMAKLNEAQARRIRVLSELGRSHPAIAEEFGVSRSQVQRIASGRGWSHL